MGSEDRDETSKRKKPTNDSQFSSMQDSCPTLPPELVTCILARLPVKSLLQFRSVSKSWLSLISSLEFVNTHLSLSANNNNYAHHRLLLSIYSLPHKLKNGSLSSLLCGSVPEAFDLDYTFKNIEVPWFVGSVNGLICFSIGHDVFLWNPSLRKSKKLPHSLDRPRCGYFMHAFGYDELHDDYKVVAFFCHCKSDGFVDLKVEIYNLKNDSWRKFDSFCCETLYWDSGKFVNGKLHWVITVGSFCSYKCGDIVSIDLMDEKWGKVEQPCYGEGDFSLKLQVLGSNLSMLCTSKTIRTDVWVMKEYGVKESWTKMYTIKFPDELNQLALQALFMSNKGEILFAFESTVFIYNSMDDSVRKLELVNFDSSSSHPVEIYIESLVSPTLGNEPATQQ